MQIKTTVDSRALVLKLKNGERKLAYAVANGINDAAKRVQAETREEIRQTFNLRGRGGQFVLRQAAIIRPFANAKQGRAYAGIEVGKKDRLLLSIFDVGGQKRPFVGKSVAVPLTGSPARPTISAGVAPELRIARLKFRKGKAAPRTTTGVETASQNLGVGVWKGQQRTYLIPGVGIFQRFGPRKRDTRMLYSFDTDVPLPPAIGFTSLWRRVGERYLTLAIDDRIKKELLRKGN